MRLIVSQHDFDKHVQGLRNCFGPGATGMFFQAYELGESEIRVQINPSEKTFAAKSDRGYEEQAVMVGRSIGKQSVLLAYTEKWQRQKKQLRFETAGFRIYVCPEIDTGNGSYEPGIPHQLMRVEWESKNTMHEDGHWIFPAENAAHPHIQFDRCNVAFAEMQDEMSFEQQEEDVIEFVEHNFVLRHSNLSWFGKLHFPMEAQWAAQPYAGNPEKGIGVPHARQPQNLLEINNWVSSVVRYIKEQFDLYAA